MSLPEFESINDLEDWCQRHNAGKMRPRWITSKRRHTFSHYHLDFIPVVAEWIGDEDVPWPHGRWVLPDALQGLPAPIDKLLKDPKTLKPPSMENLIA